MKKVKSRTKKVRDDDREIEIRMTGSTELDMAVLTVQSVDGNSMAVGEIVAAVRAYMDVIEANSGETEVGFQSEEFEVEPDDSGVH